MILPGTTWAIKKQGYIQGLFFSNKDIIKVDTIMISEDSAKVTFNHDTRRITLDAEFFRKKFRKVVVNGENKNAD